MESSENSRTSFDSPSMSSASVSNRQCTQTPTIRYQKLMGDVGIIPEYNDDEERAETVVEYEWPENSGQTHFIEEYLANYLGMKSLRRQFPNVERRRVTDIEEREHLLHRKLVSLLQCDLGIIAVSSQQVYKYIAIRYKAKFEIYKEINREREYDEMFGKMWRLASSRNTLSLEELKTRSMKACASWNEDKIQNIRKRSRYQLAQSGSLHRKLSCEISPVKSEVGYFPVMVLPGQFVDQFRRYTPEELKHLPLNTVLHGRVGKCARVKKSPKKIVEYKKLAKSEVNDKKQKTWKNRIVQLNFSTSGSSSFKSD
ncbi:unnamed protein product [Orchesella dallaii]|uniref:Uncharacterized protein n=1 Tax=Orchesella dallaii TaxID=48710 RepID=A0ABP1PQ89_9HEXA